MYEIIHSSFWFWFFFGIPCTLTISVICLVYIFVFYQWLKDLIQNIKSKYLDRSD